MLGFHLTGKCIQGVENNHPNENKILIILHLGIYTVKADTAVQR